jgi:hypothetical protein
VYEIIKPTKLHHQPMKDNLAISKYLSEVLHDWRESRDAFRENTCLGPHWPIPFFGNPATAFVATVGVNPSSGEFRTNRDWKTVKNSADWKRRLKNYFNQLIPPHEWFAPWRAGLALLGLEYENGSAAHFDVSYHPTKAMLKNQTTNAKEFRRMAERDVAWFFRLLLLCPNLQLLLIFGPIIRANGSTESLAGFLRNGAPQHGFKVFPDGKFWSFRHLDTGKTICVHEVSTPGERCITCRVAKNLLLHRHDLRQRLGERFHAGFNSSQP